MIDNITEYLEQFYTGMKDTSLSRMKIIVEKAELKNKDLKIIHVAGTNGKGSCTEMISNILVKQGYKVGKIMSPHLMRFNERISVNNINIKDEELLSIFNLNDKIIKDVEKETNTKVSFQEIILITALTYFDMKKCDFAIMEVGCGGKYDPTNIVNPIISVINTINYDHTDILGNTLEEITENKAGIIKEFSNTIFVKQEDSINNIIINTCNKRNNKLKLLDMNDVYDYSYDENYQTFSYKEYKDIKINLKGKQQIKNAIISIECINVLRDKKFEIGEEAIRNGLKSVIHKGRMEIIHNNPIIIFDGAHNENAMRNFINTSNMYYKNRNRIYIFSALKRKDYSKLVNIIIEDKKATFIFHDGIKKSFNKKLEYVDSHILVKIANSINKNVKVKEMDFKEAIAFAKEQKDSVVFIIGSLYLYKDAVKYINSKNKIKRNGLRNEG